MKKGCNTNYVNSSISVSGGVVIEKIENSRSNGKNKVITKRSSYSWHDKFYETSGREFFHLIDIGDSIAKEKTSLILEVYKADTTLFIDLSFPCDEEY